LDGRLPGDIAEELARVGVDLRSGNLRKDDLVVGVSGLVNLALLFGMSRIWISHRVF
jgi:hypothetical protein